MKWIIAIIWLAVVGFCVFGFLATFEPGAPNAIAFRTAYIVIVVVCLVGAAWPIIR